MDKQNLIYTYKKEKVMMKIPDQTENIIFENHEDYLNAFKICKYLMNNKLISETIITLQKRKIENGLSTEDEELLNTYYNLVSKDFVITLTYETYNRLTEVEILDFNSKQYVISNDCNEIKDQLTKLKNKNTTE